MINKKFLVYFLSLSFIFLAPYIFFFLEGLVFSLATLYTMSFGFTLFIIMSSQKIASWKTTQIAVAVGAPFMIMDVIFALIFSGVLKYPEYTDKTIVVSIFISVIAYFMIVSFLFARLNNVNKNF